MNPVLEAWYEDVTAEERRRVDLYARVWAAYFSEGPKPLAVKRGKPDDNVRVNLVKLIIRTAVAYLFGKEPLFVLPSSESEGQADTATAWLNDVWTANHKMALLQKVAMNGAACGHVFLKILPPRRPGDYPRLVNLSPSFVQVLTDPDDVDRAVRYLIEYTTTGRKREAVSIRQSVEVDDAGRWTVTEERCVNGGHWETIQAIRWPYDWCPIVDTQNLTLPNVYYGMADIEEDTLELNHATNFSLSNLQRILRYHAHPKTWGRGFTAQQFNIGADETIILPGENSELHNLEMTGDLSSLIQLYEKLKQAVHETTGTPEIATGKLENAGQLSGVALEIMFAPLVQKTEEKRLLYGEMLVEINRRLLDMGGFGSGNRVSITWPEVLPKNAMEERQVAMMDEGLGISKETLQEKLGYDPEQERERRETNATDFGDEILKRFDAGADAEPVGRMAGRADERARAG